MCPDWVKFRHFDNVFGKFLKVNLALGKNGYGIGKYLVLQMAKNCEHNHAIWSHWLQDNECIKVPIIGSEAKQFSSKNFDISGKNLFCIFVYLGIFKQATCVKLNESADAAAAIQNEERNASVCKLV